MSSPSVIQMNIGNVVDASESVGTNIIAIVDVNLHENMIIHNDTNSGNNIINVIASIVNLNDNINENSTNVTQRVVKSKRRLPPSINVHNDKVDGVDEDDGGGEGVAKEEDKKSDMREKRENMLKSKLKSRMRSGAKNDVNVDEDDDNNTCIGKKQKLVKKREKLSITNYETILTTRYKMEELKKLCMQYKVSRMGNKDDITRRLYDYCKNSIQPLNIQRVFRGFLVRKLHRLQGPAFKARKICTNDDDFFTMEELDEIPAFQFFSYKDDDGFVYGFNLLSFYNLLIKEGDKPKNPYNRNEINNKVKENARNIIRISRMLKIPIEIQIKQDIIDPRKKLEMKILELFQLMNSYGNYANSEWLTELSRSDHVKFARELADIWNYRAQLTNLKKMEICPPHGTPFLGTPYFTNTHINPNNIPDETLLKMNVQIIENLIKSAIDIDNKTLGSFYVLSALTLVSQPARDAMPWLYEAALHVQQ